MRRLGFYPKLAATGIRKNGNTYGPLSPDLYLYDYDELSDAVISGANPVIAGIKGGRSVQEMLGMGNGVFYPFFL